MEQEVGIADIISVLTGLIDWVRAADLERQRKLHAWPMRTLKTNYKGIDNETD